jgi:hypothetical protein
MRAANRTPRRIVALPVIWLSLCVSGLTQRSVAPAQDSSSRVGHTHDVLQVKFNPDATRLLSYSAGDGWLILWEVRSGRPLWRSRTDFIQKGDEYYILTSFAFSPDQKFIASGSGNGTVQLWDAATGKILWRADAHKDSVTAVEFSPDGKRIVSAASPKEGDDEIKILRVEDGQVIKKLEGESCTVVAMQFDEDGTRLMTGNLDGAVREWNLETGKQSDAASAKPCRMRRTYEWETSFTPDLKLNAMRTGEKELTLTETRTGRVVKRLEAEAYRIYSKFSADGQKLVVSGNGSFTFYDFATGETRRIDEFSRTGSTIDLSRDGSLFAEGGHWGNTAIKITETKTGKSWLLGGPQSKHRLPLYQPSQLELRLNKEQEQRRVVLKEAQERRDRRAAVDEKSFGQQVYITFEHYGDMTDPGKLRLLESDEPNKSKVKKPADAADAVWLRLHNDSPFPVKIPTQSMYLPNSKCFYQFPHGKKLNGLCDEREISIWHGLESKKGEPIPYGVDFGSSAILLPKTSVLFPVPREILKNGNAIRFAFTFQNETEEGEVKDYGTAIILKFRESDLPKGKP